MKLLILLSSCLFFLIGKGSTLEDKNEEVPALEPNELLLKIAEKLDRWDEFFAKKLDPPDDDVKNLQEDLKVCGSNQEQIQSLLEKIGSAQVPNETLTHLKSKLDHLNNKFEALSKNNEPSSAHTVAMKNLERKLAKLQFSLDRSLLRNSLVAVRMPKVDDKAENMKFSSPYGVDEMFMDIASKVDALYEKATAEEIPIFDNPKQVRHLGKGCRMLAGPYKKLLVSVDNLQTIIKEMGVNEEMTVKGGEYRNSAVQDIRESLEHIMYEIQILRRKNEKNINENERILRRIDKKLDSELEDDDEDDEKLKKSLKKYMIEQRKILEKNLKEMLKSKDDDDSTDDDSDDDKRKKGSKKRGKSKDDSDDSDDDDDDDVECDDSDENGSKSCEKVKKRRKDKDDSDDDDDDDDVECDDSDENGSKSCEKVKKRRKDKDDSDDDDDEVDCDDSDENGSKSCEKVKKRRKDDSDDDDDDDDYECDDSDENGSKSCEKVKKKAYSRGKKKSNYDNDDSLFDDDDDFYVRGRSRSGKRLKVRKEVREIEPVGEPDPTDKLVADEPAQTGGLWGSFMGVSPPEVSKKPNGTPDVTP